MSLSNRTVLQSSNSESEGGELRDLERQGEQENDSTLPAADNVDESSAIDFSQLHTEMQQRYKAGMSKVHQVLYFAVTRCKRVPLA